MLVEVYGIKIQKLADFLGNDRHCIVCHNPSSIPLAPNKVIILDSASSKGHFGVNFSSLLMVSIEQMGYSY